VSLSGELLFLQNHGDDIANGELGGLGEVNAFLGKDFGPAGGQGVSSLVGV
jgi:hypothetical protein